MKRSNLAVHAQAAASVDLSALSTPSRSCSENALAGVLQSGGTHDVERRNAKPHRKKRRPGGCAPERWQAQPCALQRKGSGAPALRRAAHHGQEVVEERPAHDAARPAALHDPISRRLCYCVLHTRQILRARGLAGSTWRRPSAGAAHAGRSQLGRRTGESSAARRAARHAAWHAHPAELWRRDSTPLSSASAISGSTNSCSAFRKSSPG